MLGGSRKVRGKGFLGSILSYLRKLWLHKNPGKTKGIIWRTEPGRLVSRI
jgi:hypothetical protein